MFGSEKLKEQGLRSAILQHNSSPTVLSLVDKLYVQALAYAILMLFRYNAASAGIKTLVDSLGTISVDTIERAITILLQVQNHHLPQSDLQSLKVNFQLCFPKDSFISRAKRRS